MRTIAVRVKHVQAFLYAPLREIHRKRRVCGGLDSRRHAHLECPPKPPIYAQRYPQHYVLVEGRGGADPSQGDPPIRLKLHLIITHIKFVDPLGLRHLILEAVHWYGPHHHTYKHWTRKLFRVQRSPECPKREPRAYFNSNSNSINLLAIPYNPSTAQMSHWGYAVGTFHTQQPSADSVCAW